MNFKESLIQSNKQGTPCYISIQQTTEKTYVELHVLYNLTHHNHAVSYETFYSLKPFYIRGVTTSDIEICCCKKHLHAMWSVKAFLECAKKQQLQLPFNSYGTFFEFLTADCTKAAIIS